jgi:glucosamine-6-phosphate deaminase
MFHLDEYVGLPESHPASFRRYLRERLVNIVHPGAVHLIDGDVSDPEAECARLSRLIEKEGIDVAFVGIGENSHLGFNDPPADLDTTDLFVVVELSETCRAQQVHEGWFQSVDQVPRRAITITIPGIMRSDCIICTAPERRKAEAVACSLTGPPSPVCPASVLQKHPRAFVFLETGSASLLDDAVARRWRRGAT